MNKKEVLELKKRFTKNGCTFTKMCGCYVNSQKEIILTFSDTFLNLEEEEFNKYLDIAKKTLSGTVGNNLLELAFPLEEEQPGGRQQFLMGLRESRLKNDALLERFYQMIIDSYDYAGNYLILIYHDAYDVMTKTSDNRKLDESEEVYEYLLCSICPVVLSKPCLGYLEEENRIGPRNRDWIVSPPDAGFIFPAFTDRSTDIHSIMVYNKDAKEPHIELMEEGLGCPSKKTATQQKNEFHAIIKEAIPDRDQYTKVMMEIQENLTLLADEQAALQADEEEPVLLTNQVVQTILTDSGLDEEASQKIERAYEESFGDTPPVVEHLIDNKVLEESAKIKRELALEEKVQKLQEKLEENEQITDSSLYDVILRVTPEKVNQITSQIINGKKCIVIPMEENEHAKVNGLTNLL